MSPERIVIFDTTLRDGEQSPGATMTVDEKMEVARQLARLGVDVMEAGFPASSPGDFEAVRRIAEEISGPIIAGLARTRPEDIDRCWEAVRHAERRRIHVFVATSDVHLNHKLRISKEEVLAMVEQGVRRARGYCDDVEFSPEDGSRTGIEFLMQVVETAIRAGATTINIPDTVGYAVPWQYGEMIRRVKETVPGAKDVVFSVHCHNDLGLAVANSLSGVLGGARQVECTVNGIGERAGNASLEEIVMAVKTRSDFFDFSTGIDTTELYNASRLVSDVTGIVVQPNKAIVGANAFRHEAGIHQDGVLKERTTYEIMDSDAVGVSGSHLVLGKHSGRAAFRSHLAELGYHLGEEDISRAFIAFKDLCDKKKVVTDRDIEAIIADEMRIATETLRLEHVQVVCGDHVVPTSCVKLLLPDGGISTETAIGTGPVDAIYKAIDQIVQVPVDLKEYAIKSVTEGIDALGEVTVRVECEGRVFTGRGASTDIIVASAKAYINALNKVLFVRQPDLAGATA